MLIREKIDQARQILREFDFDCWLTFVRESGINGDPSLVFLASADVTWHSAFIVSADGGTRAIVGRLDRQTVEDTGAWDEVVGYDESIRPPLTSYLAELDPKTIAVNYSESSEISDGLTHGMYLTLHAMLANIDMADRLVSAEPVVSALRERKSPTELDRMRRAIAATEDVFARVAHHIRPGMTEREVAGFMQRQVADMGLELAWDESMCPAVFTGPDTAAAHYAPSDRQIERGHVLNMDFGVKVEDYCSDMQRTFYVLEEGEQTAPPEVAHGMATIVETIETARLAIRPGVEGRNVDAVARRVVIDAGYDEYPHALGHQVGRFAHDGTALLGPEWEKYASKPFKKLEPNMVFTIEPRVTVPDRGVVTIEEMAVVTDDGAEFLSTPQLELLLIR
jgi:Xaa-Pro aminopeptidase